MTRVHHPPPAATSLSSIGRSICQAYAGVNALPSTAQPRPELEVNRLARAPRRATLRDVGVAGSNPVTPTNEFIEENFCDLPRGVIKFSLGVPSGCHYLLSPRPL